MKIMPNLGTMINDIVTLATPITSLSAENNFEKMKIKLFAVEIKKLKNENITLRENILEKLI